MKRPLLAIVPVLPILLVAQTAWAGTEIPVAPTSSGYDFSPRILAGLAAILLIAKVSSVLFERVGQPAVLGELLAGIILGNLALVGFHHADWVKSDDVIAALAQLGVILLLFEVGLESNLGEMLEVGWSSLFVAVAGVIAPFFLGWGVSAYFLPNESRLVHVFIGAVLCATSVGITARVLKDLGKVRLREARIILGAAVIDDVIGLLILATVVGAVAAAATGTSLSVAYIFWLAVKAVIFFVSTLVIGRYIIPPLFRGASKLESRGVLLVLSIAFCFGLSWLAAQVELATIVGAFAAGLVLDDVHFKSFTDRGERDLSQLLEPVTTFLVPIFFVLMGMRVDLRVFGHFDLLGFALALTIAAIAGKQICSLALIERDLNRWAVGVGMIPRGEVGLIVAGIGATLMLPNAAGRMTPVVSSATFGAVVIMVVITTLVTPPLLKITLSRKQRGSSQSKSIPYR
ncbi:MAG TPA: cation:proton antiporter [Pyrinomonadaceae bacterium]|nr:cation:proton antiporter [Pyrinomonadaceae bacterium]